MRILGLYGQALPNEYFSDGMSGPSFLTSLDPDLGVVLITSFADHACPRTVAPSTYLKRRTFIHFFQLERIRESDNPCRGRPPREDP